MEIHKDKSETVEKSQKLRYPTVDSLVNACYDHLESNRLTGERWGLKYHCYKPSQTLYGPYQWLWDSGWHQIVWSYRNVENSIADLRTLLQMQQPNGFIPQMIYWGKKLFFNKFIGFMGYSRKTITNSKTGDIHKGIFWNDITQMPMLPYSLRAIWEKTNDIALLKEFVPKLVDYHKWWHNERDHDKDGLVSIIHPWESGLDASPIYDFFTLGTSQSSIKHKDLIKFVTLLSKYKRRLKWDLSKILERGWFNVEDIGVCSCYADTWGLLSKLASEYDSELSEECEKFHQQYTKKIIDKAWDKEKQQFVSFYHVKGQEFVTQPETIQSLFPLLLDGLPEDIHDILIKKLQDPEKFGVPYPVPSTSKSDTAFDPTETGILWRGGSWGCTNWMVMEGLLKHNDIDLANHILDRWIEMSRKFGISEYHNPITGEMQGEKGLGMATTIVDMMYRLNRI